MVLNFALSKAVNRYSRSALNRKRGIFKLLKNKKAPAEKKPVEKKEPCFDMKVALGTKKCCKCAKKKAAPKAPRFRPSLQPGTVLILLAGRFRGKRVILLKNLESGLLLVTGPFRVNGVPLRRIAPSYVIATSTKVDISGVDVSEVKDEMFLRPKAKAAKKGEENFFKDPKKPYIKKTLIAAERLELQKKIDTPLIEAIKKTEFLTQYLKAPFSLKKGQYPHMMKF